jgi:hypothetical protein
MITGIRVVAASGRAGEDEDGAGGYLRNFLE